MVNQREDSRGASRSLAYFELTGEWRTPFGEAPLSAEARREADRALAHQRLTEKWPPVNEARLNERQQSPPPEMRARMADLRPEPSSTASGEVDPDVAPARGTLADTALHAAAARHGAWRPPPSVAEGQPRQLSEGQLNGWLQNLPAPLRAGIAESHPETSHGVSDEARQSNAPAERTIADSVLSRNENTALYAIQQRGARPAAPPPLQTNLPSANEAYNPAQAPPSAVSAHGRPMSMDPWTAAYVDAAPQTPVTPHSALTGPTGTVAPMSSTWMPTHAHPGSMFVDPGAARHALSQRPPSSPSGQGGPSQAEGRDRASQMPDQQPVPVTKPSETVQKKRSR